MLTKKTFLTASITAGSIAMAIAGTPTIDGTLDAAAGYTSIAGSASPAASTSFGASADASQIWFTSDATNLYYFIQSQAPTAANDGILFLMGTSAQSGTAAGTPLGNVSGGGSHVFGNTGNNNWRMEFEVDRGYVGNTGSSSANFFVDQVDYTGTPTGSFFGTLNQTGTAVTNAGGTQAFNNSGNSAGPGSSTGWEIAIPRTLLNNVTNSATQEAFAIIVSQGAFFSDDSAPQSISTGNPGNNPDFNSIAGTQTTGSQPLPVAVSAFSID